jgi:hypothetical protein
VFRNQRFACRSSRFLPQGKCLLSGQSRTRHSNLGRSNTSRGQQTVGGHTATDAIIDDTSGSDISDRNGWHFGRLYAKRFGSSRGATP